MSDPIILSGTTGSGTRYVQFWTDAEKIMGHTVAYCQAEMNDGPEFTPRLLVIRGSCPPLWVERVLDVFPGFLTGGEVPATHTVEWSFGVPTFTPVGELA